MRDIIGFFELKLDIAGTKLKNITYAPGRIKFLTRFNINHLMMKDINRKLLLKYYDRIMALSPSNILEFSDATKYATMAYPFSSMAKKIDWHHPRS